MCALADDPPTSSIVLDRELDQEKSVGPSGPRIQCPLCGWSPQKDDRWSCSCGHEWNTFEMGGGSVPRLPPPVDDNAVSLLHPLVTTSRLVCEVITTSVGFGQNRQYEG